MIQYSDAKKKCEELSSQISDTYGVLDIRYILFHNKQHNEAILVEEDTLAVHPAGNIAKKILESIPEQKENKSAFLGMAVNTKKTFFGFRQENHFMGLITINMSHHETLSELMAEVYHFTWHAINLLEQCLTPENKARLRSVPVYPPTGTLIKTGANLRGDIFSSAMMEFEGQKGYASLLAKRRTTESLEPIPRHTPEDYPFPLALEATEYALESLPSYPKNTAQKIKRAYYISKYVGRVFDEDSIQQWWDFSGAAQDMAWRKISKEDILGAASNTSENPFIKATAMLLSSISNITPSDPAQLDKIYNSFADPNLNKEKHLHAVEECFETVMERGIREESFQPFLEEANQQNENLKNGIIIGWCASALHAAANAFESALKLKKVPEHAARLEFEGRKGQTKWETIQKLSDEVQQQQRDGFAVTLSDIASLCKDSLSLSPILMSIEKTVTDPSYKGRYVEEPNLVLATPAPSNTPSTPKQEPTPMPAMAPQAPGLGGSGGTVRQTTNVQPPPQTQAQDEQKEETQ